jgi:hypothetical protein
VYRLSEVVPSVRFYVTGHVLSEDWGSPVSSSSFFHVPVLMWSVLITYSLQVVLSSHHPPEPKSHRSVQSWTKTSKTVSQDNFLLINWLSQWQKPNITIFCLLEFFFVSDHSYNIEFFLKDCNFLHMGTLMWQKETSLSFFLRGQQEQKQSQQENNHIESFLHGDYKLRMLKTEWFRGKIFRLVH